MAKATGLGLAAVLWLVSGCAGYSIQKDGGGTGYDVYTPEPYLLRKPIIASATGAISGYNFEVIWLPNYTKRYRVRSWTGFGASEFAFEFEEGWKLVKVTDKADNTRVLQSLVDLAKHVVPATPLGLSVAPEAGAAAAGVDSGQPVLYKIEFDECTGEPVRLRQICPTTCP
jgi:hypothetical protein